MLHLRATIEPVLCDVFMHTKRTKDAIPRWMRIDIDHAVKSTSSPALDFGQKIYVFLENKYLTVSSERYCTYPHFRFHNVDIVHLIMPLVQPGKVEQIKLASSSIDFPYSGSSSTSFRLISTQTSTEASSEKLPFVEINDPIFMSLVGIPLSTLTSLSERLSRNA